MPIPFLFVLYQFLKRIWNFLKDPEVRGLLVFVGLLLLVGMVYYHRVEDWSFLDSLYFTVITLTTVGYGDFAPKTVGGKIFTMIYILLGLGVLAVFVSSIAEHALEEQREKARKRAKDAPEGDDETDAAQAAPEGS